MKRASGSLRLDLAQFREMEVFTQFSSDLDDLTRRQLAYGQGLMRLLRQPQYHPLSQHRQVLLLTAALGHAFQDVPLNRLDGLREEFLTRAEQEKAELCRRIDETGLLTEEDEAEIRSLAEDTVQMQAKG